MNFSEKNPLGSDPSHSAACAHVSASSSDKQETEQEVMFEQCSKLTPGAYFCAVCCKNMTSFQNYVDHCASRSHTGIVNQLFQDVATVTSEHLPYCTLCHVTCPNAEAFVSHTRGRSHSLALAELHRVYVVKKSCYVRVDMNNLTQSIASG